MEIKNTQLLRKEAYIDGNWFAGKKGKTFDVNNPYTEKKIASLPDLGEVETNQAIEAAYWAFSHWSQLVPRERAKKLNRWAELIRENAVDLANILSHEQGKPLHEAKSEVLDAANTVQWLSEEASRVHGFTQCDPDKARSAMTIRQPMGVIGVITPWNFPFSIPAQKVTAALAAGCTVVLKPSEDTPLCSLALAYLSQEAEIPPGVFNVITCEKAEKVGKCLCAHPLVSKITFTGSTEVGKKLLEQCASSVKRITLELGGNCPAIVFDDADVESALQGVFDMKFFNAGQCCIAVNRILVHQSIYESFIDLFIEKAKGLQIGSGLESNDVGPLINKQAKKKIEELVEDAKSKGAKVILTQKKTKGLLCAPVIIKNAQADMRIFSEEIFGPVAVFYSFETEDEAVAIANDTRYGLAAYFYTQNLGRAMRVANELEAGSVGINSTNVYSNTLPFGGWKESGIGREGGVSGVLDDYCEVKSLCFGKEEEKH